MKEFDKLIDSLRKSREKCPWSNERTIEEHALDLSNEVDEVSIAIKKKITRT